jgi:hypothetical protein
MMDARQPNPVVQSPVEHSSTDNELKTEQPEDHVLKQADEQSLNNREQLDNQSEANDLALVEELFTRNPVEAIVMIAADVATEIVEQRLSTQLSTLKDEAELRGSLAAFRKANPEVGEFEPFILQELAELIKHEPKAAEANWQELLEQGLSQFKEKFRATVSEHHPKQAESALSSSSKQPYMEGGKPRKLPEGLPQFTRQQIAKMSPDEFATNEAAIELAMKHGRIR